jgi:hypothetical protein
VKIPALPMGLEMGTGSARPVQAAGTSGGPGHSTGIRKRPSGGQKNTSNSPQGGQIETAKNAARLVAS